MAKKRLTKTQKLEQDLELYKELLMKRDELVHRLQENGEHSFLNSPTYIQLQERIRFLEKLNKLSETGRANSEGKFSQISKSVNEVYADNTALLKNNGDLRYFAGITESYNDIREIQKYKNECNNMEGKLKAYKDIVAERDAEIERLQKELAECQFKLTAGSEENEIVKVPDDIACEKYSRDLSYYLDKIARLEDQVAYYKKQLEKSEKDNEKLREKLKTK